MPNLTSIDGITIANNERQQAIQCQPERSCSLVKKLI